MADNGSSMYISGAPDDNWNNSDLHNLGSVTAADFEVVKMNPIYTAANVPAGASPVITSFTASSQVCFRGHACHAELERQRRVLLDRVSGHRRRARHEHGGLADPVHDVHALRHERFWTHYGHSQYYGALSRTGFSLSVLVLRLTGKNQTG